MENAFVLTLAGLCLGIALSGLLAIMLRQGRQRERVSLGLVYISFIGMIALPLVKTFAETMLINFMPLLLVLLLALRKVAHAGGHYTDQCLHQFLAGVREKFDDRYMLIFTEGRFASAE